MKAFEIRRGNVSLASIFAEDESQGYEVFAQKCGFEDFDHFAASAEQPTRRLKKELTVRALVDRMVARRRDVAGRRS